MTAISLVQTYGPTNSVLSVSLSRDNVRLYSQQKHAARAKTVDCVQMTIKSNHSEIKKMYFLLLVIIIITR